MRGVDGTISPPKIFFWPKMPDLAAGGVDQSDFVDDISPESVSVFPKTLFSPFPKTLCSVFSGLVKALFAAESFPKILSLCFARAKTFSF
jgi:hypothetical protein